MKGCKAGLLTSMGTGTWSCRGAFVTQLQLVSPDTCSPLSLRQRGNKQQSLALDSVNILAKNSLHKGQIHNSLCKNFINIIYICTYIYVYD